MIIIVTCAYVSVYVSVFILDLLLARDETSIKGKIFKLAIRINICMYVGLSVYMCIYVCVCLYVCARVLLCVRECLMYEVIWYDNT